VAQGYVYEIEKLGKPVAVLVSYDTYMALLDELAAYQGVTR
jgi:PHD/YefM family antitoxin component YafN of YafNO toxin-antitoxin module